MLFRLDLPDGLEATDTLCVATGYLVGERSGGRVPVIDGLPRPRSEDLLKALGAAAASSGAVGLFHAVGVTPEAPSLRDALGGRDAAAETVILSRADLREALSRLSTAPDGAPLAAVSLGTPHFSLEEFERLASLLAGFRSAPGVEVYVNTGRETYAALPGLGIAKVLEAAGIIVLTDTCTYVTALLRRLAGVVMTNSGKWAHYAPRQPRRRCGVRIPRGLPRLGGRRARGEDGPLIPASAKVLVEGEGVGRVRALAHALELLGRLRHGDRPRHRPVASGLRPGRRRLRPGDAVGARIEFGEFGPGGGHPLRHRPRRPDPGDTRPDPRRRRDRGAMPVWGPMSDRDLRS